jgi:hypothetical protein
MPHDSLLELTVIKVDREPDVVDRRIGSEREGRA